MTEPFFLFIFFLRHFFATLHCRHAAFFDYFILPPFLFFMITLHDDAIAATRYFFFDFDMP